MNSLPSMYDKLFRSHLISAEVGGASFAIAGTTYALSGVHGRLCRVHLSGWLKLPRCSPLYGSDRCDTANDCMLILLFISSKNSFPRERERNQQILNTLPVQHQLTPLEPILVPAPFIHANPCRELKWNMFLTRRFTHSEHDHLRIDPQSIKLVFNTPLAWAVRKIV